MGEDRGGVEGFDDLLDAIRNDWRRLNAATGDFERRRIKREMQRRFEELRRRLEAGPEG